MVKNVNNITGSQIDPLKGKKMVGDTLQAAASSATVQQLAVILQGLLVVIGGLIAIFQKRKA